MVTYCTSQAQADAEAAEWLATAPGTGFNLDQAYGYQCVDLADSFAQTEFGVSWSKTLGGVNGAKQLMSTASTAFFEKIWNDANRPDLIPRPGDIIIWGGSAVNEWGHVAVVKTATRDGVTVVQQDGFAPPLVWVQNPNGQGGGYYSGKPAHLATLGYYGEGTGMVSGWLRPKWAKVTYTGADRRGYGPARATPVTPTTLTRRNGMIYLTDIADQLRKRGLTVVEVPGWRTRGYAGYGFYGLAGVLHHHTATGRAAYASSNAPTLNLLVNGRSDLPGPLCNLAFGRDGTVYVVAAGWANHAGRGAAPGFPQDQGNGWLIGIEAESSGVQPWDWTPDQLRVWPYLGAALEAAYLVARPADLRLQLGHREYSSEGKIDPAGMNLDAFRASINKVLATGRTPTKPSKKPATTSKEWSDMATRAEVKAAAAEAMREVLTEMHPKYERNGRPSKTKKTSVLYELQWMAANFAEVRESNTRKEKLLVAIANAVTPNRLALGVWGYTGATARTAQGKPMDAYATLNTTHEAVTATAGSTTTQSQEATK